MEYNRKELIAKLNEESEKLTQWYMNRKLDVMEQGPDGAWTAGQHLLHLIKSTKPLSVGMGYPRILLRLKFGKVKGPSTTYEGLVERYQKALNNGGKAMGEYVPREVRKEEREVLVSRFKNEMRILVNNLHKWSEKNLDNTGVPHPLIGQLTVREMMYFTIYHMEHHRHILEERYS